MAREPIHQGGWFVPKGDVAEWEILYGRLSIMKPGELLSHEQLDDLLGRDFRSNRSPIYRATLKLQELNRRTTIAVNGKGYRIASAAEHAAIAAKHYRQSRRQVRMAVEKVSSAERSELTAEQRVQMDALEVTFRNYAAALRRLDARKEGQETLIDDLRAQQNRTARDVSDTKNQMERVTDLLQRHGYLKNRDK